MDIEVLMNELEMARGRLETQKRTLRASELAMEQAISSKSRALQVRLQSVLPRQRLAVSQTTGLIAELEALCGSLPIGGGPGEAKSTRSK